MPLSAKDRLPLKLAWMILLVSVKLYFNLDLTHSRSVEPVDISLDEGPQLSDPVDSFAQESLQPKSLTVGVGEAIVTVQGGDDKKGNVEVNILSLSVLTIFIHSCFTSNCKQRSPHSSQRITRYVRCLNHNEVGTNIVLIQALRIEVMGVQAVNARIVSKLVRPGFPKKPLRGRRRLSHPAFTTLTINASCTFCPPFTIFNHRRTVCRPTYTIGVEFDPLRSLRLSTPLVMVRF